MEREIDAPKARLFTRVRPATSKKETPKRRNNHNKTRLNSLSTSHFPFYLGFSAKQVENITTEETTTEKINKKKERPPKCPRQPAPGLALALTFLARSRTKQAFSNSQRQPSQELFLPPSRSCFSMERSPPAN